MLTAFIHLLAWFKIVGYGADEIAGITVTVEFPTTCARNRAYSRLLDDALCPPSGERRAACHPERGYIVHICGININLTAKRTGY